ncbi:hemolysin family protein [Longimicrobium terrae]|uniref:Putative hemolysin n=1 Tax=Longimicrobium terrae TaxID=1639882 RepID=A0A841H6R1_9BACT|nr:hemolysin family protein [Longimicrobium terrae]MBB4638220.1 putative hemolysin [Longimicrobium terrae]MBB6073810.1 putative hemolysin [Longimicrobium terrae]NNC30302.1 HlyC/CorC family transporter [Longimicrobium terrae]
MGSIGTEVLIVILLLVANGVFSMSEIAVVSARKTRLQQRAEQGDAAAARALQLAESPERFLATVQVGITLVGTLAGAFGGARIAEPLAESFKHTPWLAPYANAVAITLVVLGITYLSLIIGELVPKQIGLHNPERIAALVAGPMHLLSRFASPLVWVLTSSTGLVLRAFRLQKNTDPPVTEAEISVLLEQGTQAGVFEEEEQELVERVFWLGDQRVVSLMTPRHRVAWLDVNDPPDENRAQMVANRLSRYLLCDGAIDRILGVVATKDLWAAELSGTRVEDLRPFVKPPLVVPESTRALDLLERFRESPVHMAIVVNEYGGTEGIVTLNDLLEEIAGEMASFGGPPAAPPIVKREDGSLLIDASLPMEEFREALDLPERREEYREYRTVGGFVFARMGRVPRPGQHFYAEGYRVEVVDMDGNRVDKVMVQRMDRPEDAMPREDSA